MCKSLVISSTLCAFACAGVVVHAQQASPIVASPEQPADEPETLDCGEFRTIEVEGEYLAKLDYGDCYRDSPAVASYMERKVLLNGPNALFSCKWAECEPGESCSKEMLIAPIVKSAVPVGGIIPQRISWREWRRFQMCLITVDSFAGVECTECEDILEDEPIEH